MIRFRSTLTTCEPIYLQVSPGLQVLSFFNEVDGLSDASNPMALAKPGRLYKWCKGASTFDVLVPDQHTLPATEAI